MLRLDKEKSPEKNQIVFCNAPIVAEDQSRNTILMINSEPSNLTVKGSPTLYNKIIDRNTGEVWEMRSSAMRDELVIPLPGNYTVWKGNASPPTDTVSSGQQIPVTQFPADVDTEISLRVPIPARWREGDIVGVSIGFIRNNGGDYLLEMDGRRLLDGMGLGGVPDKVSFKISDTDGANKFGEVPVYFSDKEKFEVTASSSFLVCRLCRRGTDPRDTNPNDMEITHVELKFEADGPFSDPNNFDVPADRVFQNRFIS